MPRWNRPILEVCWLRPLPRRRPSAGSTGTSPSDRPTRAPTTGARVAGNPSGRPHGRPAALDPPGSANRLIRTAANVPTRLGSPRSAKPTPACTGRPSAGSSPCCTTRTGTRFASARSNSTPRSTAVVSRPCTTGARRRSAASANTTASLTDESRPANTAKPAYMIRPFGPCSLCTPWTRLSIRNVGRPAASRTARTKLRALNLQSKVVAVAFVAPLEGGQTGLDLRSLAAIVAISRPPVRPPVPPW